MKIIDLLNKIANGENIKNIKYQNHIYEYCNGDYKEKINGVYYSNWLFANEIIDLSNLNDEVEIIEEEKKIPEKLEDYCLDKKGKYPIELTIYEQILRNKINEIIDYLKSKGE